MTQWRGKGETGSRRFDRRQAGLALTLLALLWPVALGAETAQEIAVTSIGKRLNVEDWAQDRAGPLSWRGGLELTSPAADFGGLSGLLVTPDGRRLTAVTDQGRWLTAGLTYDEMGNLSGLEKAAMGLLADADGVPLAGKQRQDAESLARLSNGDLLVGFERDHRIWRYPAQADAPGLTPLAGRPTAFSLPATAAALPGNRGLEALVALPGDRLLAIAEATVADNLHPALYWDGAAWQSFSYRGAGEHRPTAATRLPNGDVLLVERRFTALGGLSIRLARLPAAELEPGADLAEKILEGEGLVELQPPLTLDNFEGIAAWQGTGGETLVALLSDDNFSPLQRTLLLVFELQL
jgi:hypothetical protein